MRTPVWPAVYGLCDTRTSGVIGWLIAPRGEGRADAAPFPAESRLARGHDLAFHIVRLP